MSDAKTFDRPPVQARVPIWAWRNAIRKASVAPLTKLVCLCIADYVSDVGKGAYPSVKTLMADSGMSNRSVATHLQNAVSARLLTIMREIGPDGRFKRSTYRPLFPSRVKDPHADTPSEEASPGVPRELGDTNRVKEVHANSPVNRPKKTSSSSRTNRASRLPDDWQLPDDGRQWARSHAPNSAHRIDAEAARFADYWHAKAGKDGRKLSWEGTWRNWWRNAVDRMPASVALRRPQPVGSIHGLTRWAS